VGVLFKALQVSMQPLAVLTFFVFIAVIIFSSLMFYIEKDSEEVTGSPSLFTSIPVTIWWCVVTMTTVGYGDMAPETTVGKTLGIGVMLSGVLLLALPITVIGANFTKSLRDSQVLAMEQALRDANNEDGEVTIAEMENALKKLARKGGSKEMLLGRGGTVRDLLMKYDADESGTFNQAEMARILHDFQMLCSGASAFQLDKIEEMRQVNNTNVKRVLDHIDEADKRLDKLTALLRKSLQSEDAQTAESQAKDIQSACGVSQPSSGPDCSIEGNPIVSSSAEASSARVSSFACGTGNVVRVRSAEGRDETHASLPNTIGLG